MPPEAPAPRLDWFELGLLALFGAMSMWDVALDVVHAVSNGLAWTGTDGWYIVDQMQYLSWIQSAAHHGLIANLFVLHPTPASYFQPAILISGGLVALGLPSWLALLLWKPVAVVAIFMAVRAVAYRMLSGRFERRAAITLGVGFASFSVIFGSLGVVGDMMFGWLSWGYPFAPLAVALIVFGLLRYDRARAAGRLDWSAGLLGAVASLLHPWQGETMILLILAAELVRWRELALWWETRRWQRLGLPALTLALVGLPLLYYLILGHADPSWTMARQQSKHTFPWTAIAIGAAPLAVVAALGYRGRAGSYTELVMRVWPAVAVVIYIFSRTGLSATPLHAMDGITIPLAVLAVKGVSHSRLRTIPHAGLVAGALIVLAVIPANAYTMAVAHEAVDPTPGNANFITTNEHAALRYLAHDPRPGGVLSQFYLGEAVPGATGRRTFVGNCMWSEPNCMPRSENADALFRGQMPVAQARRFVATSGARFLLASCSTPNVNLQQRLGADLIVSARRFGCATVYEVASPPARS